MSTEPLKQAQITQLRARLITLQQELTKSLHIGMAPLGLVWGLMHHLQTKI